MCYVISSRVMVHDDIETVGLTHLAERKLTWVNVCSNVLFIIYAQN